MWTLQFLSSSISTVSVSRSHCIQLMYTCRLSALETTAHLSTSTLHTLPLCFPRAAYGKLQDSYSHVVLKGDSGTDYATHFCARLKVHIFDIILQ